MKKLLIYGNLGSSPSVLIWFCLVVSVLKWYYEYSNILMWDFSEQFSHKQSKLLSLNENSDVIWRNILMLSVKSNEDYQLTTNTTPTNLVLPTNHQHNSTNLLLHLTSSNQLPEKSIYTQNSYGMMNIKLYTKLNTILKLLNVSKVLNQFK